MDKPEIIPYVVQSAAPRGAVIVCPGGGYAKLAPHEGEPIAKRLNAAGISAFVLNYRLAPNRHPVPLNDAKFAVRYVRVNAAQFNILPDHIAILGFSAGGHLAATLGTHFDLGDPSAADPLERLSCRPDALVLCYAVISFGAIGHKGSIRNLIGENPPPELVRELSNEMQVTNATPPAFLWSTSEDKAVPAKNSILFAEALARNGVPYELHVFQRGGHGLGLAEAIPETAQWAELCCRWLHGMGF